APFLEIGRQIRRGLGRLQSDRVWKGNPTATTMKNVSRGLAALTVPFTMSFPKIAARQRVGGKETKQRKILIQSCVFYRFFAFKANIGACPSKPNRADVLKGPVLMVY
ncbi:unnamed protein product, partial [Prunus brigantina]